MENFGYTNLIVAGCSNSSYVFGKPWSFYLKNHFHIDDEHFLDLHAAGAGVSNYVDRVMRELPCRTGSLVIVQITDTRRLSLGLSILDGDTNTSPTGVSFKGVGNYSWAYTGEQNWGNFSRNLNGCISSYELETLNITPETCDFISKQIVMSDYTPRYSLMSLFALKAACDMTDSTLLLFPWFQDWNGLWSGAPDYPSKKFNYIEQGADEFLRNKGFNYVEPNHKKGGHYDSDAHETLCYEYLLPVLSSGWYDLPKVDPKPVI